MEKKKTTGNLKEQSKYSKDESECSPEENSKSKGYEPPKKIIVAPPKAVVVPGSPKFQLLKKTYRKNQVIVTFTKGSTPAKIEKVKGYFYKMGIKGPIKIVKCGNGTCDLPVQLWIAEGIDTVISGKGVKAGAGPGTETVGESYSLNFLSQIPVPVWQQDPKLPHLVPQSYYQKEIINIAVLDTGIDPYIVDDGYVPASIPNKPGFDCVGPGNGWNFVNDSADIEDDSEGRHGSLVTQYIINEFKKSSNRTVQIIPLKTHDRNGQGDLFKIFCAVNYAVAKGANIINASWGFYYYESLEKYPLEQFNYLLKELKNHGILFVTAAGNQDKADDNIARKIMAPFIPTAFQLRDLDIHEFLPACLSKKAKNLVAVTTTDGVAVASTENHSKNYVDIGVIADKSENSDLWFEVPFKQNGNKAYVRGSSFATAIATGIIGVNGNIAGYAANAIDKKSFISDLLNIARTPGCNNLCKKYPSLVPVLIKNGIGIESIRVPNV